MNQRSSPIRCFMIAILAATAILATMAVPKVEARANTSADDLARLKAEFVLGFVRYADWPPSSFPSQSSPIRIRVADDRRLIAHLVALAEGRKVNGRRVLVGELDLSSLRGQAEDVDDRLGLIRRLHGSQVVFIGHGARDEADWLLARLAGEDVLTVSDLPDFAKRGGMIGLVVRDGRLELDANLEQIATTRVSVGSQVLRLARIVGSRSPW